MLGPTWFTNVESSWDESPFARFFRGLAGFARAEKAAATLSTPIRTSSHNSSPMWLVTTLPAAAGQTESSHLGLPVDQIKQRELGLVQAVIGTLSPVRETYLIWGIIG